VYVVDANAPQPLALQARTFKVKMPDVGAGYVADQVTPEVSSASFAYNSYPLILEVPDESGDDHATAPEDG
jgi:hypothetical protein